MTKLAIDGGTPVFEGKRTNDFAPVWPIPFPETEQTLLDVYRSSQWGVGNPWEKEFVRAFAAFQGAEYCVGMVNGTTTIECALLALGVGPGDEVIVPGITWVATGAAPVYCDATPVVVDVTPDTLCLDPDKVEAAITPRTRAIIPVHVFSAMADMDRIMAIARKHHLFVVEDAAHAHGARQHGKGAGSIGHVGSFSFQTSKLMTAGEGGCCITNDLGLYDRIYRVSHIGNAAPAISGVPEPTDLAVYRQYRFTAFQSAILLDQLRHIPELMDRRAANAAIMAGRVKDIPGLTMQASSCPDDVSGYYFTVFLLDLQQLKPGMDRAGILKALQAEGVDIGEGWGCPVYDSKAWNIPKTQYIKHDTPNSDEVSYKRLMAFLHNFLLADSWVIEKAMDAIARVMNCYTIGRR